MTDPNHLVGRQIDQYQITQYLASGGMADVYRADDTTLKRTVCLKVMLASLVAHPQLAQRFQREAETIANLEHYRIINIYNIGMAPGQRPYLAMEYIENGSLYQYIASRQQRDEELSVRWVLLLMKQIAEALVVVHQAGIIHRDLKPSNILMRSENEAVLADMGIVAVQTATRLTLPGHRMPGTPQYMSPEQIQGHGVDGRSDIYATGIILYELLGGQRPFDNAEPQAILYQQRYENPLPLPRLRPGLSMPTYHVVETCLQKDPVARYPDSTHLVAALTRALAAEQGGSQNPYEVKVASRAEDDKTKSWRRWGGALPLVVAAILLLALVFSNISVGGGTPTPPTRIPTRMAGNTVSSASPTTAVQLPTPPSATNTPLPSATFTPSFTPAPTETPMPTATSQPTWTPWPSPSPISGVGTAATCLTDPGPRWGSTLHAQYGLRLGCAQGPVNEPTAAYQVFQKGLMVWRADRDLVYVLYYDNGTYGVFDVRDVPNEYDNHHELLKSAFGWVWNTFDEVNQRLSTPTMPELNASEFAVQDFSNGTIFYFLENNANHYVLYRDDQSWFTPFD